MVLQQPTMTNMVPNPPAKSNKVMGLVITALVVIVLIAVLVVVSAFFLKNSLWKNGAPVVSTTLPEGYTFNVVGQGEYPADFPKTLILSKDANIVRGEDTIDGSGNAQKIVEYITEAPLSGVVGLYQKGLDSQNWKLTSAGSSGSPYVMTFVQGESSLYVIISPITATSTQVNLTYIK